ncbi:MAG: hypothetical protein HYT87_12995 [Nitrospirae bacterium]|nr:hypothetical protein [Nitrospirota bacterium]
MSAKEEVICEARNAAHVTEDAEGVNKGFVDDADRHLLELLLIRENEAMERGQVADSVIRKILESGLECFRRHLPGNIRAGERGDTAQETT